MSLRSTRKLTLLVALIIGAAFSVSATAQTKKKGPPKYSVPEDTLIRLRIVDALNSKHAKVGDQFKSTVVDPVYAKGFQVIPAGSVVVGEIKHVERASRKSKAGSLNVIFTAVELPNGKSYPLNGSLATSDSTNNEGEVKGRSSKKRNAAFIAGGAVVGGAVDGATGAGVGAGTGIGGALLSKGKEAEVKSGTEFQMILNWTLFLPEYKGGD